MNQLNENVEHTFFQLSTGVDTLNYLVIADTIHVATHQPISPTHAKMIEQFRSMVCIYGTRCMELGGVDSEEFRKLNLAVINSLAKFLVQVEQAGLWLVMRMWSDIPVDVVTTETHSEEDYCKEVGDEPIEDEDVEIEASGFDAVVGPAAKCIPFEFHALGNEAKFCRRGTGFATLAHAGISFLS